MIGMRLFLMRGLVMWVVGAFEGRRWIMWRMLVVVVVVVVGVGMWSDLVDLDLACGFGDVT